jgi:hypothetical protein
MDDRPRIFERLRTILVARQVNPAKHPWGNLAGGEVGLNQGYTGHYQ